MALKRMAAKGPSMLWYFKAAAFVISMPSPMQRSLILDDLFAQLQCSQELIAG